MKFTLNISLSGVNEELWDSLSLKGNFQGDFAVFRSIFC